MHSGSHCCLEVVQLRRYDRLPDHTDAMKGAAHSYGARGSGCSRPTAFRCTTPSPRSQENHSSIRVFAMCRDTPYPAALQNAGNTEMKHFHHTNSTQNSAMVTTHYVAPTVPRTEPQESFTPNHLDHVGARPCEVLNGVPRPRWHSRHQSNHPRSFYRVPTARSGRHNLRVPTPPTIR